MKKQKRMKALIIKAFIKFRQNKKHRKNIKVNSDSLHQNNIIRTFIQSETGSDLLFLPLLYHSMLSAEA